MDGMTGGLMDGMTGGSIEAAIEMDRTSGSSILRITGEAGEDRETDVTAISARAGGTSGTWDGGSRNFRKPSRGLRMSEENP
jgi:hypothetical protein|tara:strand:+ start:8677 stop:8922 length:246 start_codon:yes stop_codon:yes gene_type:complete